MSRFSFLPLCFCLLLAACASEPAAPAEEAVPVTQAGAVDAPAAADSGTTSGLASRTTEGNAPASARP